MDYLLLYKNRQICTTNPEKSRTILDKLRLNSDIFSTFSYIGIFRLNADNFCVWNPHEISKVIGIFRCWWRLLETKFDLETFSSPNFIILNAFPAWETGINIQKLSPWFCHQHIGIVINVALAHFERCRLNDSISRLNPEIFRIFHIRSKTDI